MTSDEFPVVGIGASAGGIEALSGFFEGMPQQPGVAFIIVTHLNPERESLLHEIVRRHTDLPVHVAADGMVVEVDCVYVMPADALLGIDARRLTIRRPEGVRRERKPIDLFFSALAVDQRELAVGVVLSGGDGDGTLGIKAIKERGGLAMAQTGNGHGPAHPSMPDSAIASGLVDFAITVDAMGPKLVEFARGLHVLDAFDAAGRDDDTIGSNRLDDVRQDIYAILRNQVGHDFGGYKPKTFMRRVQRRMQIRQIGRFESYTEILRQEPLEVGALFRDLLISVTNFFRDTEAFEQLAEVVIPTLFEGRGAGDTVRVWVPGCATGEEVFSLSILLREYMDTLSAVPRVQVFATDIDERALMIARAGRYPAALLDSVSPERRRRFFVADGGSYVVSKEVRDLCIFSPHSVIRDPPFSRIDLVSCRNLLIYFGIEVQRQVVPVFHYALRPEGYLFLGTSENISQFDDLFTPVLKGQRIFRKRADTAPAIRLPLSLAGLWPRHAADQTMRRAPLGSISLRQSIESQVLDQFAPPHVVVNRDGDIVYYSARTGKYLEAAPGVPTRQLLDSARKGLRLDLRTVLREVMETGRPVVRENVAIENEDGRVQVITLAVAPVEQRDGAQEPLYIVLFTDRGPTLARDEAIVQAHSGLDAGAIHLEHELRDTRERLQSLIEEYETALEELKSSNEELVSVNEELQSTNEELEASQEELQSVNEELQTVNSDLSSKIDALDRAHSDLQNLFESTEIATVFLDNRMVIRSFTPAVSEIFNILPGDQGRPITDLSSRFNLPNFAEDIAAVAAGGRSIERRVERDEGRANYLLRLKAYRDRAQRIDGVVVTFVNVTSLTRAEQRQRILISELQHRTRNLLAVVQALARQTLSNDDALDAFFTRLAALSRVQSLIANSDVNEVPFAELVRLELQAHGAEPNERISVSGPPVNLSLEQVQILALALHELATNAIKHGALRTNEGSLAVSWSVEAGDNDTPHLVLEWQERRVTMPTDLSRSGYGRRLIEEALAFTLRARTRLVFGPDGVFCRIELPLMSQQRSAVPDDRPTDGQEGEPAAEQPGELAAEQPDQGAAEQPGDPITEPTGDPPAGQANKPDAEHGHGAE